MYLSIYLETIQVSSFLFAEYSSKPVEYTVIFIILKLIYLTLYVQCFGIKTGIITFSGRFSIDLCCVFNFTNIDLAFN